MSPTLDRRGWWRMAMQPLAEVVRLAELWIRKAPGRAIEMGRSICSGPLMKWLVVRPVVDGSGGTFV